MAKKSTYRPAAIQPGKAGATPDAELLRSLLRYEPETGRLFWRVSIRGHIIAGAEALKGMTARGYRRGGVNCKPYMAHRIIWKMVYGYDPPEIDHIDGNGLNNRLENLRAATRQDNVRNVCRKITNKSGCTGVHFQRGYWVASIRAGGKQIELGYFKEKADAVTARKQAEREYGYHPNHGREPCTAA